MKDIRKCFENMQDITPYIKSERVDEGLMDVLKLIKTKIKNAFTYLKGIVGKFGAYFLPMTEDGIILPAITPLTAGAAYKDGYIDKSSTFVKLDKEGSKITGCNTKYEDALKLYGSGNSISYWRQLLKESNDENIANILEYLEEHNEIDENLVNEVKLQNDDPEAKYNVIVDDDELKKRIKMVLKNKQLARLLIWGAPGIGKTAILLKVLEEMKEDFPNYQLIVKTLSNETPDNFTLPKYVSEVDDSDFTELAKKLKKRPSTISKLLAGLGMDKATDVPKTWLPVFKPTGKPEVDEVLDAKCGEGLLFIDELSRASQQVLNVILPLINEGLFNGYKLGSGWTIVCASNRASDDEGQEPIGNALANRFLQVHYEPTVKTWRKWADKQNFISPLLLQWLSMPESEEFSGGKFYYMDPNEDSSRIGDTTLMCTPRAWTNAMRVLASCHHTGSLEGFNIFDIPRDIIASMLNSTIPASAIDSFLSFLATIEKIGNFDQAVYDIWQHGGGNTKIDKKHLNRVALPLSQLIVCAHSSSLPTKEEWENLSSWLVAQNSDQLASYVLDVFQNVFLKDLSSEKQRIQFFMIQEKIRRANGDTSSLKLFKTIFEPVCRRWGIDFDQIPDYWDGLVKLTKKYGESFASAKIGDWESVLG